MSNNTGKRNDLSGWSYFAALVALAAFAAFVMFMIGQADADEPEWSRLAWIFGSVEAIAFAAAGALFGSSIQRQRAERAEAAAAANAQDAASGRALARSLKAEDPSSGAPGLKTVAAAGESGEAVAKRHAALARDYFPDD